MEQKFYQIKQILNPESFTGIRQTHPCWKMELVQKAVF